MSAHCSSHMFSVKPKSPQSELKNKQTRTAVLVQSTNTHISNIIYMYLKWNWKWICTQQFFVLDSTAGTTEAHWKLSSCTYSKIFFKQSKEDSSKTVWTDAGTGKSSTKCQAKVIFEHFVLVYINICMNYTLFKFNWIRTIQEYIRKLQHLSFTSNAAPDVNAFAKSRVISLSVCQ